jgi:hypothetical protein
MKWSNQRSELVIHMDHEQEEPRVQLLKRAETTILDLAEKPPPAERLKTGSKSQLVGLLSTP